MNGNELLAHIWNLRAHPFCPDMDPIGRQFSNSQMAKRTLDPALDLNAGVTYLYFDVYDWTGSQPIIDGLIAPDGLRNYPDIINLVETSETLVVIISGLNGTGVRSLANLIRYKVTQRSLEQTGVEPLFFVPRLTRDSTVKDWALTIVDRLIFRYAQVEQTPSRQELRELYKEKAEDLEKRPGSYGDLITAFADLVRPACQRPFIMQIDDRENIHPQYWMNIYNICRGLINLLIIPCHDRSHGKIGHNTFVGNNIQSVLIQAKPLNIQKAYLYLQYRLSQYRNAAGQPHDMPDIAPFSEQALARLYERTNPKDPEPYEWVISKLNKSLQYALDEKINELEQHARRVGQPVFDDLNTFDKLIGPDLIDYVIDQKINKGL